jgi:hypothetical protein
MRRARKSKCVAAGLLTTIKATGPLRLRALVEEIFNYSLTGVQVKEMAGL